MAAANQARKGEMAFQDWLQIYEREQETHSQQIGDLARTVGLMQSEIASISANISSLLENQRGISSRVNRPWQWNLVLSVFAGLFTLSAVFGTILNLSLSPVMKEIGEINLEVKGHRVNQMEINMWLREAIEANSTDGATSKESRRWLETMSVRNNEQIDLMWMEMKRHHTTNAEPAEKQ